jgi:hypothetical protein
MVVEKAPEKLVVSIPETLKNGYLLRRLLDRLVIMPKRAAPGSRPDPKHRVCWSCCNRRGGFYRYLPVYALEVGL